MLMLILVLLMTLCSTRGVTEGSEMATRGG
jgi:hypothetical protein